MVRRNGALRKEIKRCMNANCTNLHYRLGRWCSSKCTLTHIDTIERIERAKAAKKAARA